MKLELVRELFTEKCTIGRLWVDGVYLCHTLEDVVRDHKIAGSTAIPEGTYMIVVDMSQRFKKLMPRLLDVPNYTGVRIHSGNTSEDTEGCILVGYTWGGRDYIGDSRKAFGALMTKLNALPPGKNITIAITRSATQPVKQ